jgi:hypothetical protein
VAQHPTRDGKVNSCAVLDMFSRRIVGWSIADHIRAELVVDALAINNRPRKSLGWKTPAEVVNEHLRSLQRSGAAMTD